jgi:hypothetical protein
MISNISSQGPINHPQGLNWPLVASFNLHKVIKKYLAERTTSQITEVKMTVTTIYAQMHVHMCHLFRQIKAPLTVKKMGHIRAAEKRRRSVIALYMLRLDD